MSHATAINRVFIGKRRIAYFPSDLIGEGGEAEIYRIDCNLVLKVFKPHRKPTYQNKLRNLPVFPPSVVAPLELCTDSNGEIAGFTMPFIDNAFHLRSLANKDFRSRSGISAHEVIELFKRLHEAVKMLHAAGVVIGDFNPFNVLVQGQNIHLLDADSMQFNGFACDTFTARYTDPLNCDPAATVLTPISPHTTESDWYAFALMLFESVLYVHPYAGIHKPASGRPASPDLRPLLRLSVLNPDVAYPAAGLPYTDLPVPVLQYFKQLLELDVRGVFPIDLLDALQGKAPPITSIPAPMAQKTQDGLRVRKLFHTDGALLCLEVQNGRLHYLFHESGSFKRENGAVVLKGILDHALHFQIHGEKTAAAKANQTFLISNTGLETLPVELYREKTPVISSNGVDLFWCAGGELWHRSGAAAVNHHVQSIISRQTKLFAGKHFCIGLAQAGALTRCFVFDKAGNKIPISLPDLNGFITDASCYFGNTSAWLVLSITTAAKTREFLCVAIDGNGTVFGSARAAELDDSWLSQSGGRCAAVIADASGHSVEVLFVATRDGIAQIAVRRAPPGQIGSLKIEKLYAVPDLVLESMRLAFSPEGLIVYDNQDIYVVTSN